MEDQVRLVHKYVLGFAFDERGRVLLRLHEDAGPESVRNRWNGLGGKIELPETEVGAMRREFREESGLDVAYDRWEETISFGGTNPDGSGWQVACYRTKLLPYEAAHIDREESARTANRDTNVAGTLRLLCVSADYGRFDALPIVPNLRWLVPLHHLAECMRGCLHEAPVPAGSAAP